MDNNDISIEKDNNLKSKQVQPVINIAELKLNYGYTGRFTSEQKSAELKTFWTILKEANEKTKEKEDDEKVADSKELYQFEMRRSIGKIYGLTKKMQDNTAVNSINELKQNRKNEEQIAKYEQMTKNDEGLDLSI